MSNILVPVDVSEIPHLTARIAQLEKAGLTLNKPAKEAIQALSVELPDAFIDDYQRIQAVGANLKSRGWAEHGSISVRIGCEPYLVGCWTYTREKTSPHGFKVTACDGRNGFPPRGIELKLTSAHYRDGTLEEAMRHVFPVSERKEVRRENDGPEVLFGLEDPNKFITYLNRVLG
ncbi:hypothetical protein HY642_02835 [Candidatus Woesearchaeota archaeon]|nr:hypothetical protein [Candidatus Woesearchaeota archaeon]